MGVINPILKNKVQSINDYTSEPLNQEEISELGDIVLDKEADMEERILSARIMVNVCTNRLHRAQKQIKYWGNIHLALEHEFHSKRAEENLIKDVADKLDLENPDVVNMLKALLEKVS